MKKLIEIYKIPLLISMVLAFAIVGINLERNILTIAFVFIGSILGIFALDLDYLVYAFFLEPKHHFSTTIKTFLAHKDLKNAAIYSYYHRTDLEEPTLNSFLFQIILAFLMIYIQGTTIHIIIKILLISAFINSIYRMYEYFYNEKLSIWFWALKSTPSKNGFYIYTILCLFIATFTILFLV
jgi:hypothetical protein